MCNQNLEWEQAMGKKILFRLKKSFYSLKIIPKYGQGNFHLKRNLHCLISLFSRVCYSVRPKMFLCLEILKSFFVRNLFRSWAMLFSVPWKSIFTSLRLIYIACTSTDWIKQGECTSILRLLIHFLRKISSDPGWFYLNKLKYLSQSNAQLFSLGILPSIFSALPF